MYLAGGGLVLDLPDCGLGLVWFLDTDGCALVWLLTFADARDEVSCDAVTEDSCIHSIMNLISLKVLEMLTKYI